MCLPIPLRPGGCVCGWVRGWVGACVCGCVWVCVGGGVCGWVWVSGCGWVRGSHVSTLPPLPSFSETPEELEELEGKRMLKKFFGCEPSNGCSLSDR